MDLDYRALSNAGLWCVGRLQTDADRARVIEALVGNGSGVDEDEVRDKVKRLAPRWFVMRDVHAPGGPVLLETRAAMSWLRGPMTRAEVRRARETSCPEPVTALPEAPSTPGDRQSGVVATPEESKIVSAREYEPKASPQS